MEVFLTRSEDRYITSRPLVSTWQMPVQVTRMHRQQLPEVSENGTED